MQQICAYSIFAFLNCLNNAGNRLAIVIYQNKFLLITACEPRGIEAENGAERAGRKLRKQ